MTSIPMFNNRGFSLIEIMVVVVIMGILAGAVTISVIPKISEAKVQEARIQINTFKQATKLYRLSNDTYPTTEQGLQALVQSTEIEPIPKRFPKEGFLGEDFIPLDPWGNEYIYVEQGEINPGSIDLISLGADGQESGEGDNEDVYND